MAVVLLMIAVAPLCAILVARGMGPIALGLAAAIPVGAALLIRPFLGIVVWLLLMPYFAVGDSSLDQLVGWAGHRLLIPGMLLLVAVYHFTGLRRSSFRLAWYDFALVGFLLLAAINIALLTDDPQRMGVAFHSHIVAPIMLFWLVRSVGLEARDIRALVVVGFITVSVQTLVGLTSWVAPGVLPSEWLGRVGSRTVGTLGGPAPFTATIVFFSLLLVHNLRGENSRWFRAATLLLFVAGLGVIFLSLSRGSWLGAAAAMAGLALLYPKVMLKAAPLVAVGVLALALSPLGEQLTFAQERVGDSDTVVARQSTNDAALQMISDRPVLGFGYGNFEVFDESYKRPVGDSALKLGGSAHHAYLALAAENGLLALVLYFLPIVGLGYRSIKGWRRLPAQGGLDRPLLALLWLALLDQFLVSNATDILHSSSWGTGLWWLTLGLIAVLVVPEPYPTTRRSRP